MKIENHLLFTDAGKQVPFVKTPNVGASPLKPRYLVMHYTAGSSARESIGWLANSKAKASAHIVIGRDGSVTQMVPFNKVAWHAGVSSWEGIKGLNAASIGIELDNPGRLTKKASQWLTAFGGKVPAAEVLVATHKNESEPAGWAKYPQAQLDAAREVAKAIVRAYGLKDVIGHEDIAPKRKSDPGPAFPMAEFRAAVMAKDEQPARPPVAETPAAPPAPLFRTTTILKIRGGPGVQHEPVNGSPLPEGTTLRGFEDRGDWKRVEVQGKVRGVSGISGWVAAKYLAPVAPTIPALKIAGAEEATPAGV